MLKFFKETLTANYLLLVLVIYMPTQVWSQNVKFVDVDLEKEGRTFEGIGGVSAGASSELLVDYPEPQKSQILDFLFKPKFGASLQQLKVEIGADAVVVGSEPSHARTMEELKNPKEEYYKRGYEFWLMKEAQNRNDEIILSALEWAAPGYLQSHWTKENADYIINFILGAKKYWGIEMDYISPGKNESEISPEWLKSVFKPRLDSAGLSHIKILAPDNIHRYYEFCELMAEDPELEAIVDAVGYHYIFNHLPEMDNETYAASDLAKELDCSIWASEDWSMYDGSWDNSHILAGILNKMYIRDRVTAMQIWCPVDGYYDNVGEWNSTGLMKTDQPWSGYYEVSPAIWVVAHFTQFISTGWKYLDSACGYFGAADGGNYTTLISPDKKDMSIMVYTNSEEVSMQIDLPKSFADKSFTIWKSNKEDQFIKIGSLKAESGSLNIAFDSMSIYTLSTTNGQEKGSVADIPQPSNFQLPFRTDFEKDDNRNGSPRFFADIEGTFELKQEDNNQFLEQQIVSTPINWTFYDFYNPISPLTEIGDVSWEDCKVSVDVQIPEGAFAQIFLRVSEVANFTKGYSIKMYAKGNWEILYDNLSVLGSGDHHIDPGNWTNLAIKAKGDQIQVFIEGEMVKSFRDDYAKKGMVAIGSSWHKVRFDNFSITE